MNDVDSITSISDVAYQFLKGFSPEKYEDGRYNLANGLYVNIETYETHDRKDLKYEAHKKYIDIQYMIDGEEIISVSPLELLEMESPYDEERDISFYNGTEAGKDQVIHSGCYIVLYPCDAHMPCIAVNNKPCRVRKMVIKVPIKGVLKSAT